MNDQVILSVAKKNGGLEVTTGGTGQDQLNAIRVAAAATFRVLHGARNLRKMNRDGRGQEDADDLTADIMLACTAIGYVAEFAVDKCRFMPVRGNEKGKGKGR